METKQKNKTDKQQRIELRRKVLIDLSVKARALRERMAEEALLAGNAILAMEWADRRVNDIIADWYREQTGATTFKTFRQWQGAGFSVKRGSKAFTLWGKKRKASQEVEREDGEDPVTSQYELEKIRRAGR